MRLDNIKNEVIRLYATIINIIIESNRVIKTAIINNR